MTSVPPRAAHPEFEGLAATLRAAVPGGEVKERSLDRIAYGADASDCALVPQAVVVLRDRDDVVSLFRASGAVGVPLTFRSGGTSMSGQGATDAVLVDTRVSRVSCADASSAADVNTEAMSMTWRRAGRSRSPVERLRGG